MSAPLSDKLRKLENEMYKVTAPSAPWIESTIWAIQHQNDTLSKHWRKHLRGYPNYKAMMLRPGDGKTGRCRCNRCGRWQAPYYFGVGWWASLVRPRPLNLRPLCIDCVDELESGFSESSVWPSAIRYDRFKHSFDSADLYGSKACDDVDHESAPKSGGRRCNRAASMRLSIAISEDLMRDRGERRAMGCRLLMPHESEDKLRDEIKHWQRTGAIHPWARWTQIDRWCRQAWSARNPLTHYEQAAAGQSPDDNAAAWVQAGISRSKNPYLAEDNRMASTGQLLQIKEFVGSIWKHRKAIREWLEQTPTDHLANDHPAKLRGEIRRFCELTRHRAWKMIERLRSLDQCDIVQEEKAAPTEPRGVDMSRRCELCESHPLKGQRFCPKCRRSYLGKARQEYREKELRLKLRNAESDSDSVKPSDSELGCAIFPYRYRGQSIFLSLSSLRLFLFDRKSSCVHQSRYPYVHHSNRINAAVYARAVA